MVQKFERKNERKYVVVYFQKLDKVLSNLVQKRKRKVCEHSLLVLRSGYGTKLTLGENATASIASYVKCCEFEQKKWEKLHRFTKVRIHIYQLA